MSLDYNLKAIDPKICFTEADAEWPMYDADVKMGDKYMRPETERLIYLTMAVGMGAITETNYHEFYLRVRIWGGLHGESKHTTVSAEYWNRRDGTNYKKGDYWITRERVRDHIGLKTNVTTEGRAKWIKRIGDSFVRELKLTDLKIAAE
jgi:hypothetical protein